MASSEQAIAAAGTGLNPGVWLDCARETGAVLLHSPSVQGERVGEAPSVGRYLAEMAVGATLGFFGTQSRFGARVANAAASGEVQSH